MKKVLFSAFAFFSALSICAENSINVTPIKVAAGTTEVYVYIEMNNDVPVYTLQFDLITPEGITPYLNKSGKPVSSTLALVNDDERVTYYDEDEEDDVTVFSNIAGSSYIDFEGHKVLRYNGAGTFPVAGNSGKLFKLRLVLSEGLADGVYPITVNRILFLDNTSDGPEIKSSTSYIVVGNPENQTFAVNGQLPSFVNQKLTAETAISSLDLSNVTAINGDFTYVDGRAVTAPAAELEVSAKYAKTVAEGKYASLTLPFDATFDDETAYTFTEVEGDYAKFDAVNSAQAGDVVLLTKSVNLTGSKLSTVAGATAAKAYYVSQDGSELRQGTNVNVPALRGVWEIEGAGSNLRIMLDGIATDIKMSDLVGEGAQAFDLQGRRTANAKNGVYVVNGKKQIVK